MRNRYVLLADAFLLAAAMTGAFVLRFDLEFLQARPEFWFFLVMAWLVKLPVFYGFGLYHRYWRYASAVDVVRIVVASTIACSTLTLAVAAARYLGPIAAASRAVLAIDWLLTIMVTGGIRLAIRLEQDSLIRSQSQAAARRRTLVVGAGSVGMMVARLAEEHRGVSIQIVGFVDDDPAKLHKSAHGHRVLGPCEALEALVTRERVEEVIVAMPSAPRSVVDEICDRCDRIHVKKRVIPDVSSLMQGTLSVDDMREWRSQVSVSSHHDGASLVVRRTFDRILVTGGAGFIGANFVRYFLDAHPGSTVVVFDKMTYAGNPDNLLGLDSLDSARYFFVQGDICDREAVQRCVDDYQVEAIVNFAAETHVDRSLHLPDVFLQTNVVGTQSLLEVMRKCGSVRHFHQVSTDEVYGEALRGSFSEDDPIEARSPYSASKAGADMVVTAYAASYGLSATITRGSNNMGPYQYLEKAVPLFVTAAIDFEPLPVYGDGLYVRDYLYVLDHCRGIDTVMRAGVSGEIYNVGGGHEVAAIDLARAIVRKLGRPDSLLTLVADRAGQDRRYSLNCAKVRSLGWKPEFTFDEGLEKTIQWYVDNEWWWRKIKNGEYREYFDRQLRWRLEAAVEDVLSG